MAKEGEGERTKGGCKPGNADRFACVHIKVRTVLAVAVAVMAAVPAAADTSPRPRAWRPYRWEAFKPGSTASFKLNGSVAGGAPGMGVKAFEYTMKVTLERFEGDEVVLTTETTVPGAQVNRQESRVPKSQVGMPFRMPGQQDAKVLGEGREVLTVAGRRLACRWQDVEAQTGGLTINSRIWTCADVPMGIVKSTMSYSGPVQKEMTMELESFERR